MNAQRVWPSTKSSAAREKAAILFRAIGEEAAAAVMKSLDPKDIGSSAEFMKETANINEAGEEQRDRGI